MPSVPEVPEGYRRQGLPLRFLVDREGDMWLHLDGRQLMVAQIGAVLKERRDATAASNLFIRHSGWAILPRPVQETVLSNLT